MPLVPLGHLAAWCGANFAGLEVGRERYLTPWR